MGKNHIRVLRNIPEVDEIVISDIDNYQANIVAKQFGITKIYNNQELMLEKEKPDGVIVATPPGFHKENVLSVINAGVNVLVEKPIAHDIEDAEEMILAANKKGIIFTVGHIERFNPVVSIIKKFIDSNKLTNIYLVNSRRVGPFPKRLFGNNEGVLIDLAVHDFDIINYIAGDIINIRSQIIDNNKQEIYVKTLLDLENNIKGSSEFSWITPMRKREIEVYGSEGMLHGDLIKQVFRFYENGDFSGNNSRKSNFIDSGLIDTGKVIQYPILKKEPLLLELENFIKAIAGKTQVLVKPNEALRALQNVLNI